MSAVIQFNQNMAGMRKIATIRMPIALSVLSDIVRAFEKRGIKAVARFNSIQSDWVEICTEDTNTYQTK